MSESTRNFASQLHPGKQNVINLAKQALSFDLDLVKTRPAGDSVMGNAIELLDPVECIF